MMHLSLTGQCPCAVLIPSSTKIRSKSQFSSDRWAEVFQAHFIHQAMRFYNFWGTVFYSMFTFIKYVVPNRSLCIPASSWHLNHLFTTTVSSAKFLIILNEASEHDDVCPGGQSRWRLCCRQKTWIRDNITFSPKAVALQKDRYQFSINYNRNSSQGRFTWSKFLTLFL